jgi:hypothetical protein
VQELGGLDQLRADASFAQIGDGRLAGVVRAPHPGEDERARPGGRSADAVERTGLLVERGRRASDRVRLAEDLCDEWVRKVS